MGDVPHAGDPMTAREAVQDRIRELARELSAVRQELQQIYEKESILDRLANEINEELERLEAEG